MMLPNLKIFSDSSNHDNGRIYKHKNVFWLLLFHYVNSPKTHGEKHEEN